MVETDIFISGGGLAGLSAAAAAHAAGANVILADPAPPVQSAEADGSDLRSTAYLQPAKALFEHIGLWSLLAPHATPLTSLRVIDTEGDPPVIRTDRTFQASDLSDDPFGWNVPNWLARKVLVEHLGDLIDLRLGVGFSHVLTRDKEALVTLSDGTRIRAKLAIAADGRASPLRAAAGIDVKTTRYAQKALAFAVAHDIPHDTVSTEIYASGGAFTLVPLADHEGRPASAVVWMEEGPKALALSKLSAEALGHAATERSAGVLGSLTPITPIRVWPIVTQEALRLTARRVAVMAEAAHVLPPIGAQGLNTSLQDVAALADCLAAFPDDIGGPEMLGAYAKARQGDVHTRARAIDAFNRICKSDAAGLRHLRSAGLSAVHDIMPLRMAIMRKGLGA